MSARRLALAVIGLAAAFAAGWLLGRRERPPAFRPYELRAGQQAYLNPLLECEVDDPLSGGELRHFDEELDELAAALEAGPHVARVAVYFRALNNGMWLGRNEREGFIPASLAKVPVVIACLRQAEEVPTFLARTIRYEGLPEEREPGFMNPEVNLEKGEAYTVLELIRRVGRYSDNAAARLLTTVVDPAVLAAVKADLGLPDAGAAAAGGRISPREYGALFRILYNASYIGQPLSRIALDAFAQSTFELGLVAGVPEGTAVSHKFGVWEGDDPAAPFQLHDCGIVYHQASPYLLCVMTSGSNYVGMASSIAEISRFVYRQVDQESARGTLRSR
jgi:hypothetical protein